MSDRIQNNDNSEKGRSETQSQSHETMVSEYIGMPPSNSDRTKDLGAPESRHPLDGQLPYLPRPMNSEEIDKASNQIVASLLKEGDDFGKTERKSKNSLKRLYAATQKKSSWTQSTKN